jgi:excisionase family DNA binding protein
MSWLNVREAAESLGVGQGAVYQLVAAGKLACYRLTPGKGRMRFRLEDLAAYVEASRVDLKARKAPAPRPRAYVKKYPYPGRA